MCYMRMRKRVGVRELRQNLSVYLRRVDRGESLEITDRGRLVGVLVPASETLNPLERLVAAGHAAPARGDLLELGPPPAIDLDTPLSAALEELRSERL